MIEKLKSFTESVKNIVLYIVGPILALLAYIAFEKGKNTTLEDKTSQDDVNAKLATEVAKAQDAQREAANEESNYNAIRDAFIKQSSVSVGQSEASVPTTTSEPVTETKEPTSN